MTQLMWNQKVHYCIYNSLHNKYVMMNLLGISVVELEVGFRLFQQNVWGYRYGTEKGCSAVDGCQHFGGFWWLCFQHRRNLLL